MTPHKHFQIASLWLAGVPIQGQSPTTDEWIDVPAACELEEGDNSFEPNPIHHEYSWWPNWRVKPE